MCIQVNEMKIISDCVRIGMSESCIKAVLSYIRQNHYEDYIDCYNKNKFELFSNIKKRNDWKEWFLGFYCFMMPKVSLQLYEDYFKIINKLYNMGKILENTQRHFLFTRCLHLLEKIKHGSIKLTEEERSKVKRLLVDNNEIIILIAKEIHYQ